MADSKTLTVKLSLEGLSEASNLEKSANGFSSGGEMVSIFLDNKEGVAFVFFAEPIN